MVRNVGWIVGWLGLAGLAGAGEVTVRVVGGNAALGPVAVLETLPSDLEAAPGAYRLEPAQGGGPPCPATVYRDGSETILAAVIDRIDADQTRTFRLVAGAPEGAVEWRFDETPDGFHIVAGGEPVAGYHEGETKPYWHPVVGPGGVPMTRGWPMAPEGNEQEDHPHQRSMWFTHGDVNGVDFWASDPLNKKDPKLGTIRRTGRFLRAAGPGFAAVRTGDAWLDGRENPVCDDIQTVRIWDAGDVRLIDVEVEVRASHGPVTFGDTKEGVFGVRVPTEMAVDAREGGRIVNAEGLTDAAAWGKRSAWVDYSGRSRGEEVGLAILDHPSNLRHPTTWHVRTYGLFAANPFGYHDFGIGEPGAYTIPEGGSRRFRYRVVLHWGDAEEGDVARQFEAFARPPKVEIAGGR